MIFLEEGKQNLGLKWNKKIKIWCVWTVVLEKTLETLLDCKEIKPVSPKGNQSWIFIGRTDTEAEAPMFWPPDTKNWFIGKDPDAGEDWRQEEKGTTEDETVGWHHRLNGQEFEQTWGDGEEQGNLACCSPWNYQTWLNDSTTNIYQGIPGGLVAKNPPTNAGVTCLILVPGRSHMPWGN